MAHKAQAAHLAGTLRSAAAVHLATVGRLVSVETRVVRLQRSGQVVCPEQAVDPQQVETLVKLVPRGALVAEPVPAEGETSARGAA